MTRTDLISVHQHSTPGNVNSAGNRRQFGDPSGRGPRRARTVACDGSVVDKGNRSAAKLPEDPPDNPNRMRQADLATGAVKCDALAEASARSWTFRPQANNRHGKSRRLLR